MTRKDDTLEKLQEGATTIRMLGASKVTTSDLFDFYLQCQGRELTHDIISVCDMVVDELLTREDRR